jgi:hypothetical protein
MAGRWSPLILTTAALVAGCGKSETVAPTQAAAPPLAQAQTIERPSPQACTLVTQAEMSSILGGTVVARNNDHSTGKTECIYEPATGSSPYAEVSVEWGSGEGAMMGVGMLNKSEPGIASPYDGIGDQAIAVGSALMIRTGDDLVTLVFSGVEDEPAAAKAVFARIKERM